MSIAIGIVFPEPHQRIRSLIVYEEEDESAGDYGSWAKQSVGDEPFLNELTIGERGVIQGYDKRARYYSKRAARYKQTHLILSIISIVAAALVPVAIAVGAPTWTAAVAGAVTTIVQSVIQLTHADHHAVEIHSMLVRLTARRDGLRADVRAAKTATARSALVDAYEQDAIALTSELSTRLMSLDRSSPKPVRLRTQDHPG